MLVVVSGLSRSWLPNETVLSTTGGTFIVDVAEGSGGSDEAEAGGLCVLGDGICDDGRLPLASKADVIRSSEGTARIAATSSV